MTLSVCFLIHLEACAIFFRKLSGTGIKINLIKLWWWPLAHVLCKWEEAASTPTFLCVQPSNYHFSLITSWPLGLQYHRLYPHARTSNLFFLQTLKPSHSQSRYFIYNLNFTSCKLISGSVAKRRLHHSSWTCIHQIIINTIDFAGRAADRHMLTRVESVKKFVKSTTEY